MGVFDELKDKAESLVAEAKDKAGEFAAEAKGGFDKVSEVVKEKVGDVMGNVTGGDHKDGDGKDGGSAL